MNLGFFSKVSGNQNNIGLGTKAVLTIDPISIDTPFTAASTTASTATGAISAVTAIASNSIGDTYGTSNSRTHSTTNFVVAQSLPVVSSVSTPSSGIINVIISNSIQHVSATDAAKFGTSFSSTPTTTAMLANTTFVSKSGARSSDVVGLSKSVPQVMVQGLERQLSERPESRRKKIIIIVSVSAIVLTLTLVGGFIFFYLRRDGVASASANHSLRSESSIEKKGSSLPPTLDLHENIYGGTTTKTSKSGKVFRIRQLFNLDRRSNLFLFDDRTPPQSPKKRRKLMSDMHIEVFARNAGENKADIPQATELVLSPSHSPRSPPTSADYPLSSIYSTDLELPFRLGSPVRSTPALVLPHLKGLETYHVPSWRLNSYEETTSGARQSLYPRYELNHESDRQSHFILPETMQSGDMANESSRFSGFSSSDAASHPPTANLQRARPELLSSKSRDYSKPTPFSFAQASVANRSPPDQTTKLIRQDKVQLEAPSSDQSYFEGGEGRRTQVYKLLKRALGR